eukprot:scaffold4329_cov76-Skeletonema_dohrnii-CCMP3373.AAC.1
MNVCSCDGCTIIVIKGGVCVEREQDQRHQAQGGKSTSTTLSTLLLLSRQKFPDSGMCDSF